MGVAPRARGSSIAMRGLPVTAFLLAMCVGFTTRLSIVAAGGEPWSEEIDLDGIDEYLMESPKLVEEFLQVAMREIRSEPGYNKSTQSKMIFPGGKLHNRALRAGADRGMLRLGGPPPVEPPALAGAKGAASLSASGMGVGNGTDSGEGDEAVDGSDDDDDEDDDLKPYVNNAWGSGDVLGGLFVSEEDDEDGNDAKGLGSDNSDSTDSTDTDAIASATAQSRRARRAAKVGEEILHGAVAGTGGLLPADQWVDLSTEKMSVLEVPWLVGAELAEKRVKDDPEKARNETLIDEKYAAMFEWFTSKGGQLNGVVVDTVDGKPGDKRGIVANTTIDTGQTFLRVPVSLTLSHVSSRNLRSAHLNVGEQLKGYHQSHPEQALAVLLLHEWLKEHLGVGSKWGPYLRTLTHPALGKATLRAMAGTYAAEVHAEYIADAIKVSNDIQSDLCLKAAALCSRLPGETGAGTHTRDDFRWALGIVRQKAVWVTKRTTGVAFPALVPFLDSVPHHPNAGGSVTLELDSAIVVTSGGAAERGTEMAITKEPHGVTDAESLCRWHHISPGVNSANGVRLKLPGASVTHASVGQKVILLRQWRKEMAMPPRGADLWRAAVSLGMYGDGDEELEAMKNVNSQSLRSGRGDGFAALAPNGEGGLTVEEELMLTGQAKTPQEAAATAAAFVGLPAVPFGNDGNQTVKKPILYTTPDPDEPGGDDPVLENARKDLARHALQTQAAAALGEYVTDDDDDENLDARKKRRKGVESDGENVDCSAEEDESSSSGEHDGMVELGDSKPRSDGGNAAAEALVAARDFFQRGVPPPRGLDSLDLFLIRKSRLMAACGDSKEYLLSADGPSKALMCATRVLLANETEVAALEGPDAVAPMWDSSDTRRNENAFDASVPLSAANERAALRRLATAATNVLLSYRTSEAEDLEILQGEDPDDVEDLEEGDEDFEGEGQNLKMPSLLRTKGGAVRAAVAVRLREKRLLKSAMFVLSRREREIDTLKFQVDERANEVKKAKAELLARKIRAKELYASYFSPNTLATLEIEVVQSEEGATSEKPAGSKYTATAVLKEGDDIETVARKFASKHAVDASAVPQLVAALQPGAPSRSAHLRNQTRPALVAAVPVVVPSGAYGVLTFRQGDDLHDICRVFAGIHEIPEWKIEGLVDDVNKTLVKREKLPIVLQLPVTAPDGRQVVLALKDGDQHGDLPRVVERWCIAERVPRDTAGQLVLAARKRLDEQTGPVLVSFPVGAAGQLSIAIEIRTTDPEKVLQTVKNFCVTHELELESAPGVARTVLSRLDPAAVLVDADPAPKKGDEWN